MERKKLEELNLMDDFLFQEVVTRGEEGKRFCRMLLRTILGREIGRVKIIAQKSILGRGTGQHGIKIDAYIEEEMSEEPESFKQRKFMDVEESEKKSLNIKTKTDIYDIEPNKYRSDNEAKRTRYYHAVIDTKILPSGTDYSELKNVTVIMILPYDPFGKDRMVYTIKHRCVEDASVAYEDGSRTIYLYTEGTQGNPSQELRDMLKYIKESRMENAVNEDLQNIHRIVEEVKADEEAGISYMKAFEMERVYRKEGFIEGKAEGEAKGRAESVLRFLGEFGEISEDLQKKILGERDTDRLEKWLKLSIQTTSVEEFIEQM